MDPDFLLFLQSRDIDPKVIEQLENDKVGLCSPVHIPGNLNLTRVKFLAR